jgi:hypothetical protein
VSVSRESSVRPPGGSRVGCQSDAPQVAASHGTECNRCTLDTWRTPALTTSGVGVRQLHQWSCEAADLQVEVLRRCRTGTGGHDRP